ncbi:hypothetical protein SE17_12770 [Kouleothrix aurantiaca]|uniref:Uncharacterized protein n=1 Tax=Kouleothrix aurantiaca TaxID=186479 RepID=A0A0N8PSJ4_9CHLR|nr:hypothetical protein SE17_12770 [Kouleothrix aurantiaca]
MLERTESFRAASAYCPLLVRREIHRYHHNRQHNPVDCKERKTSTAYVIEQKANRQRAHHARHQNADHKHIDFAAWDGKNIGQLQHHRRRSNWRAQQKRIARRRLPVE